MQKITPNEYENFYWEKGVEVIGIDEAGRGPLAGPLVVAGVVFEKGYYNPMIYDSKGLSEKKRKELFKVILKDAKDYRIYFIEPKQIDKENIYRATQNAMDKIASDLKATVVLTDAMPLPQQEKEVISLIKGDQKSISIAAASILAKVVRDARMKGYDFMYPQYGFAKNKGYPTKQHITALKEFGALNIHRQSYGPVREVCSIKLDLK